MTVRDLGYRAYEGELKPPSQNFWVMLRHGLFRIWGSWVNRLVILFCWVPLLVMGILALLQVPALLTVGGEIPADAEGLTRWFLSPPPVWCRTMTGMQFWFCATLVTIRSGAGVISEDLNNRAYQFYFSKPVTPIQYLAGRAGALAIIIFLLTFIPTVLFIFITVLLGPEDQRLERLGLILPAILDGTIVAVATSALAVATSALSKSRALTLTAWVLLLFVPFALAFLVQGLGNVEWVFAISIPGLLWSVGDAIYKVDGTWDHLRWFHTAPLLIALVAGGMWAAHRRIQRVQVVT